MNPKSLIPITTAIFLILLTIPTHACSETHGCFQVTWKPIYMGLFTQKYLINIKNICDSTNYTNTSLVIYNASFDGRVTIHTYRIFTQIKTITKPIYNKIINQTYNFTTNPWNISIAELYNKTNSSLGKVTNYTLTEELNILTNYYYLQQSLNPLHCYYLNNQSFNCETLAPNYVNQTITEPFYKPIPTKLLYDQNGTYIFNITDNIYNPYETKQFLIKINYPYYVVNHKLHLSADVAIAIDNYLYHPWFNTSWGARYPLYINNTPRVVKLNITWVTGMQGNFSDLRFTYYNPITQNETELPYWISYYQPYKYAIVYVRLNPPVPINTNNATIYVYYDNPTAPPASNFTATITEIPMQLNITFPQTYAFNNYVVSGKRLWLTGTAHFYYPAVTTNTFEYVYGYLNLTNTSNYEYRKISLPAPLPITGSLFPSLTTSLQVLPKPADDIELTLPNGTKYILNMISQDNNQSSTSTSITVGTTTYTLYSVNVSLSAFVFSENNLSNYNYIISPMVLGFKNLMYLPDVQFVSQGVYPSNYKDSAYVVAEYQAPTYTGGFKKTAIFLFNASTMKFYPVAYFDPGFGQQTTAYPTSIVSVWLSNYSAVTQESQIEGFSHIYGNYYALLYENESKFTWSANGSTYGTINTTLFEVYMNGTQFKFLKNITIYQGNYQDAFVANMKENHLYCPTTDVCYAALVNASNNLDYLLKVNMTSGNYTILRTFNITALTGSTQAHIRYIGGVDNGTMLYIVTGIYELHFLYNIKTNQTYYINTTLLEGTDYIPEYWVSRSQFIYSQNQFPQASFIHDVFTNTAGNQTNISIWTIPVFAQPAINVTLDYKVKQGYYQWYINSPPTIKILYPFTDAYTNLNLIRIYASDDNSKILNVTVYMYGQVIYQNSSYINGTSVNIWYPAPSTITPYVVYAKASDGTLTSYSDYIYFHYVPPSYTNYEIGSEATYSVNGYPSMSIGYIPNITMPGLNTMSEPYFGYSKEKMQEQKEKEMKNKNMKNKKMKKKKHNKGDLIVTPEELDFYFPGPNMCSTSSVTIRWMGDKPATVTTSTDITGSYVIWQPNNKFNVVLQPGESKVVKVEVCTPFNFMLWPNEASAMLLFYASSGTNMIIRPVLIRIMKGKKKMIIKKHKKIEIPKGPVGGGGGGPGGWGSELAAAINKAVKYTTYLVLAIVAIVVLKMVLLHISTKGTLF